MGKQLCSWKPKRIRKRQDELVELIADPTHFCAKCGRAANRKRVLCKPKPLHE